MNPEDIFNKFPIIEVNTDFILRPMIYDDAQDYFEYLQDKDVNRYVPEECLPRNLEQAKEEIKYNLDLYRYKRSISWAIGDRNKNNKFIGSCGFNYWNRDHNRAEISFDIAKKYWGKGIMTKISKSVLGFAFIQMQMNRIEATVEPNNIGSLKVLKKCGFKKEGVLREQKLLHGKFCDAVILSILKKDFIRF